MSLKNWNDERMEILVGGILRGGVIIAAAVILFGGVLYLVGHGGELPQYVSFHGEPLGLRGIGGIIKGLVGFQARAIIQIGFLLLIATPVARVAFSVFGFAREGDRTYVIITSFVLVLLLYSLFHGIK
jgi:uncharacterized membrane protein